MAKQELVATIRDRYRQASKKDLLDEFITGHHRKHGIGTAEASRPWEGDLRRGRKSRSRCLGISAESSRRRTSWTPWSGRA